MAGLRAGFTTRASCLIAAGGTALLCGMLLGETDLVRAGVLALAVPTAAALVVFRSRVLIANRRSAEPTRAVAGATVVVHLSITNRSLLRTGALMLEDQLPGQLRGRARFVLNSLGSREARTVSYRMPRLPRGRYRAGPLRIRLTDPFHLVDVMRSFTATNDFLVAPVVDPLPDVEPPRSHDIGDNAGSHSIGSHGADDASTREYRTGDDLRKIHWRSSARTGALMVRQEERPWQGQVTLLLDLREKAHVAIAAVAGDDPADDRTRSSLEWAISATASIGTHLMLTRRDVALVSDLTHPARLALNDPAHLSEHLAAMRAAPQGDLVPLGNLVGTAARESTLVAVLGDVDPRSLRLLADVHPRGSAAPALAIVLDTPTWAGADASGPQASCNVSARALRAAGWRAVVVGRDDSTAQAWQSLLRIGRTGSPATAAR